MYGSSLPPQEVAVGDPKKPWLFWVSHKWKKAMEGFFHGQRGSPRLARRASKPGSRRAWGMSCTAIHGPC
jgi:hypothetical protein